MTDDERIARLRRSYHPLLDPAATGHDLVHDEPAQIPLGDMRRRLRERFERRPEVHHVQLRVGGLTVGIATRESCGAVGLLGPSDAPAAGAGEGATLPGRSTRYGVVAFRCAKGCPRRAVAAFYDERRVPPCPEHGPMELVR